MSRLAQFLSLSDLIVTLADGYISERSTWNQLKTQSWSSDKQVDEELPVNNLSDDAPEEQPIVASDVFKPERSMDSVRQIGDSAIYQHYISAIGKSRIMATIFIMI